MFDGSVLGMGYTNPKARTGVFRATESLWLELMQQPQIQIHTVGWNGFSTLWEEVCTRLYLQTRQPQQGHSFRSLHHSRLHLGGLYQAGAELQKALIHRFYAYQSSLYKGALGLQIPFKLLSKLDVRCQFDPKTIDLYHSPFWALPPQFNLPGIPRILTVHDLIPVLYPQFFTAKIRRQFEATIASIDRDRDWILCNSHHTKQDFCEYTQMHPDRVFVTPLAAASHFRPVTDGEQIANARRQYGIPDTPYLLSLATLEPRKNLSFLIRCFRRVLQQVPDLDLSLVLVGPSGWHNADIFRTIQQDSQLAARIILTGYVADQDLSAIYSGATAFVYPSFYEGFGLPPLEAMQCGTPVITSNTSSLPEVVGKAGVLIAPTLEEEWCQAVLNVVQDQQWRLDLAQRALQQARRFSWATCAKQTVEVYQIAAANRV